MVVRKYSRKKRKKKKSWHCSAASRSETPWSQLNPPVPTALLSLCLSLCVCLVGFTFGWILSGFKCSEAPWSGKGGWGGGMVGESRREAGGGGRISWLSVTIQAPKANGWRNVEGWKCSGSFSLLSFFLFFFFFYLCVISNRTSSSNENHFEMCINPHDMEAEFQSDDERNNSDGNMEFVR